MSTSSLTNEVTDIRHFGKQILTENLIKRIMYWDPPVPAWIPLKKTKNSSLRFACIAEENLSSSLAFEGEMIILTPDNWQYVLQYCQLDFILIESFWETSSGYWYMGLFEKSPYHNKLMSLLKFAKQRAIPTVFWFTKGHEYHNLYKYCVRYFDLVCCADPTEIKLLAEENIQANLLLPCVQPALYNPFRHFAHGEKLDIPIIFDGWADIDRFGDKLSILNKMLELKVKIIESRYKIFRSRLQNTPKYAKCILGCTTQNGKISALKYANTYISIDTTLSTRTIQQWMALEAAASRVALVHAGTLRDDDLRCDFVIECPETIDCLIELVRHREDPLYRERLAHLGWRYVNLNHTFAHRMRTICTLIGITHNWQEFPKASLITPTMREHQLEHCLNTFEQSTYPNKELIVVFNGNILPTYSDLGLSTPKEGVTITQVPGDLFAASALNMGNIHASGDYCFRIDDDDYYAPNYILDMILHARSIDADFFGKPRVPLVFDGDSNVYATNKLAPLTIIPCKSMIEGKVWLGGNTFSGFSRFFHRNCYLDTCYGAADSTIQLNMNIEQDVTIASMDLYNVVATRRADTDSHTWKAQKDKLLSTTKKKLRNIYELTI